MNSIILSNDQLTMSSREIAEFAAKEHKNVKRDIVSMFDELVEDRLRFERIYLDSKNREQTEYILDKDHTLTLIAGYSAALRRNIIRRWQELEELQQPKVPTTFIEAMELAVEQAKQLELAAPKVAFVENLVERDTLMTATQIAQKHGMSAIKLNRFLDELGGVYSKGIKRGRAFIQKFIDDKYGEVKQTELGHSQCLFTPAGEVWIHSQLISEGAV